MYHGSERLYIALNYVIGGVRCSGFSYILNLCVCSIFVIARYRKCMLLLLPYTAVKVMFLYILLIRVAVHIVLCFVSIVVWRHQHAYVNKKCHLSAYQCLQRFFFFNAVENF